MCDDDEEEEEEEEVVMVGVQCAVLLLYRKC